MVKWSVLLLQNSQDGPESTTFKVIYAQNHGLFTKEDAFILNVMGSTIDEIHAKMMGVLLKMMVLG